ncbi:MAG: hypothetical protein K9N49_06400 [Candidatus Marinimicrobia bacterium]|nr:hypothetical protein [Candidatus Neomarinimicrobiota bacterium]
MGKKKKNKQRRHESRPALVADPVGSSEGVSPEGLFAALGALRGRRAQTLAERLAVGSVYGAAEQADWLARGYEAYLRELLANGHTGQARDRAQALRNRNPALGDHWALSLQVRLGLVSRLEDRLADPAWRARLRAELVTPEDLLDAPAMELAESARRVMQAWEAAANQRPEEAATLLGGIGRHNLLVDWRLFLEVLLARRAGDPHRAAAAWQRMLPNCPARALADCLANGQPPPALFEPIAEATGESQLADPLAAVQAAMRQPRTHPLQAALEQLLSEAQQQTRPGLATSVLAACMPLTRIRNSREWQTWLRQQNGKWKAIYMTRVLFRAYESSADGLSPDEIFDGLEHDCWSDPERAFWLLLAAQRLRDSWLRAHKDDEEDEDDDPDYDLDDDEREGVQIACAEAARRMPNLRAIYPLWDWALADHPEDAMQAALAFHQAFPADPEALEMLIRRLASSGRFAEVPERLAQLRALPGERKTAERLERTARYLAVKQAYEAKQPALVEQLGGAYADGPLFERMAVAVYRWLAAPNKADRRARGLELDALASPWLVLYTCRQADARFNATQLPASVKRALQDDPNGVLAGYRALATYNRTAVRDIEDQTLWRPLVQALEHPATTDETLRSAMRVVVADHHPAIFNLARGRLIDPILRLLDSPDPDDQALGLIARAVSYALLNARAEQTRLVKCLNAAWNLAADQAVKALLLTGNPEFLPPTSAYQQVAKPKDTQRELKTQRKLRTPQGAERHFLGRHAWPPRWRPTPPRQAYSMPDELDDLEELDGLPPEIIEKLLRVLVESEMEDDSPRPPRRPRVNRSRPPTAPRPLDLSRSFPVTSMEFELLIERVGRETPPDQRAEQLVTIATMIESAPTLSPQAKERLLRRCAAARKE